jgi:hypothetical protein
MHTHEKYKKLQLIFHFDPDNAPFHTVLAAPWQSAPRNVIFDFLKEKEDDELLKPILTAFAAAGKIPTPKITTELKGKVLKEILKELKDKQESYTLEKIAHEFGHVIWRVSKPVNFVYYEP